jgi:hypothetical protein
VEALAAELALGIASATERAEAVVHLAHCQTCRRLVDELASVADGLLLLAPEAEPSIGFESRVLVATGLSNVRPLERPGRPGRPARPRRWIGAAAAVVALAGAGGAVAGGLLAGNEGSEEVRSALSVSANGRATCRAFAFSGGGGDQAWVVVSLETPSEWTADYTVEVTGESGAPVPVGNLRLQNGHASLTTRVSAPADSLRTIRVFDSDGELRYEAPFEGD